MLFYLSGKLSIPKPVFILVFLLSLFGRETEALANSVAKPIAQQFQATQLVTKDSKVYFALQLTRASATQIAQLTNQNFEPRDFGVLALVYRTLPNCSGPDCSRYVLVWVAQDTDSGGFNSFELPTKESELLPLIHEKDFDRFFPPGHTTSALVPGELFATVEGLQLYRNASHSPTQLRVRLRGVQAPLELELEPIQTSSDSFISVSELKTEILERFRYHHARPPGIGKKTNFIYTNNPQKSNDGRLQGFVLRVATEMEKSTSGLAGDHYIHVTAYTFTESTDGSIIFAGPYSLIYRDDFKENNGGTTVHMGSSDFIAKVVVPGEPSKRGLRIKGYDDFTITHGGAIRLLNRMTEAEMGPLKAPTANYHVRATITIEDTGVLISKFDASAYKQKNDLGLGDRILSSLADYLNQLGENYVPSNPFHKMIIEKLVKPTLLVRQGMTDKSPSTSSCTSALTQGNPHMGAGYFPKP